MGIKIEQSAIKGKDYPNAITKLESSRLVFRSSGGTVLAQAYPTEAEKQALVKAWSTSPTPPPVDPPPPTGDLVAPPTLTSPTTVDVPSAVNSAITLDKSKDYILVGKGAGGLKVIGGRNVIWRGGHITIPYVGDYSNWGGDGKKWQRARFGPDFEDFTGTVFVEDFRMDGVDISEGIDANTSSPNTKFVLQKFRIGPVTTRAIQKWVNGSPTVNPAWGGEPYAPLTRLASGKYWDNHGDAFQSWSMPTKIILNYGTVITSCQFNFLEGPHSSEVLFKNINIKAMDFAGKKWMGGGTINKGNSGNPDFKMTLENVWIEPIFGSNKADYTQTYSGDSSWESAIQLGTPADFVP